MQANRWAWRYADKHGYMENWIYPNRPLNYNPIKNNINYKY